MFDRGRQLVVEELLVNYPLNKCAKHAERSLELYCNTCHKTVCVSCSVDGTHRAHDKDEVVASLIIVIIIIIIVIIIFAHSFKLDSLH